MCFPSLESCAVNFPKANARVHKDSFSLAMPYAKWSVYEIIAVHYVCPFESNSDGHKHYALWLMKSGKHCYVVDTFM